MQLESLADVVNHVKAINKVIFLRSFYRFTNYLIYFSIISYYASGYNVRAVAGAFITSPLVRTPGELFVGVHFALFANMGKNGSFEFQVLVLALARAQPTGVSTCPLEDTSH